MYPRPVILAAAFFAGALSAAVAAPPDIRVATFNAALSPDSEASLEAALASTTSLGLQRVAEIIQRTAPDILLINELNYPGSSANLDLLNDNYLAISQNGQAAQNYPHRFVTACNTGIHSGLDFDNSGTVIANPINALQREVYAGDCYGFGRFPGQFGMAVLSKYPIRADEIRTLQNFLWQDMPGALLPDIPASPAPGDYYSPPEREVFRLSSKSHWDIPVEVGDEIVHLLCSHPTPPTFDGSEDRNGKRNHDEIRLWADYIEPARDHYIYDDDGVAGGLGTGARFVILGDNNADPDAGDSVPGAAQQFTTHPLIDNSIVPARSDGVTRTSGFGLRVDYVLPSRAGFEILGGAVFWPMGAEPGASLVSVSDHRLVYLDLRLEPFPGEVVPDLQIVIDAGDAVLSWSAAEGIAYTVQCSADLANNGWSETIAVSIDAGVATARDVAVGGAKFYRVTAAFE